MGYVVHIARAELAFDFAQGIEAADAHRPQAVNVRSKKAAKKRRGK